MNTLESIIIPPIATHTATVIFVHGLGDSGNGWKGVAEHFARDPALQHTKWILPHAPIIPITSQGGVRMRAWYDLLPANGGLAIDAEGLIRSSRLLTDLIRQEIQSGFPVNRIILGGFSQGGTLSLFTGLTNELRLGGIVVLSGRLAMQDKIKSMMSAQAKSLPLFWGHGQQDPLLGFSEAQSSVRFMTQDLGIVPATAESTSGLEFHGYADVAHNISEKELSDLGAWFERVIPNA